MVSWWWTWMERRWNRKLVSRWSSEPDEVRDPSSERNSAPWAFYRVQRSRRQREQTCWFQEAMYRPVFELLLWEKTCRKKVTCIIRTVKHIWEGRRWLAEIRRTAEIFTGSFHCKGHLARWPWHICRSVKRHRHSTYFHK